MNKNGILAQVCSPIDWREDNLGRKFDPDGSKKGLAIAEAHFAGNEPGLLEFIAGLLSHYACKVSLLMPQSPVCDFSLFARRATEIIKATISDPSRQVGRLTGLARNCIKAMHYEAARGLLQSASGISGANRSSKIALLEARREFHQHHDFGQLQVVLRLLIEVNEENGTLDSVNRCALAEVYSKDDRFTEARSLLEPLVASESDESKLLELVGIAYFKAGKYAEAKPLLERLWQKDQERAGEELAETYFRLGDMTAAASTFREVARSLRFELDHN